jgi:hypothetical protein
MIKSNVIWIVAQNKKQIFRVEPFFMSNERYLYVLMWITSKTCDKIMGIEEFLQLK